MEDVKGTATVEAPSVSSGVVDRTTMPDLLDRTLARFGENRAIDFLGRAWTYRQVGALVDQVAAGLQRLGTGPGDRIGLCLPNTPYSVVFFFAVLKTGATVVNFNPLYTAREIEAQIRDSGTTAMVVMDLERIYRPVAEAADATGLAHIIVCPMADVLPTAKSILFRLFKSGERARIPADTRHVTYADLTREAHTPDPVTIAPDALAVLQYTGGTTGTPKGAMLTHANLVANVRQVVAHGECAFRDGEERVLCVLPFFHIFALTVALNLGVVIGAELVLLPQFKLTELLKTIGRRRPTLLPAVPTLYGAIAGAEETRRIDLSCLRICISGGAPLPAEIRTRFEDMTGCRLAEGYGLTEASPVVSCNPVDARANRDGSAGLPLPDTLIEIRDPDAPERLMPPGERGEVCIRGPQVMAGYWNRPQESDAVMIDGALRTGDIGYLDADGYLFLVDRIKDLIICSGYNVYPRMIEEALYEHEAVCEAVVIGVPDPYRGESPKAFVTLREGAATTADDLMAFLSPRLSKIEMPRSIEIRDSLPKTMVGKLSKKALVEEERAHGASAPGA
ncbi:long-chain-fatty-acid--CoA ligase [Amorphus orientalis]|uniref:Long-chain acyl-CoA synthetase n=1 Tax=Amorphus orientalis TaxID=649198 RepID=A0AAE3VLF7_9HYPH|nr:long-chain fatty acid--CoA ligase [Amorphus orientalis]MDQ0314329.1 long-chain acyl-CoA synthetase [Amorphus orientalis]